MSKKLNQTFKFSYYLFIVLLSIFIAIGCYSYYSTIKVFGRLPKNNELNEVARTSSLTIKTFPIIYGETFLSCFFLALFIIPLFILINYITNKKYSGVAFYPKHASALILIFMIAFIFFLKNPVVGWYWEYLAD